MNKVCVLLLQSGCPEYGRYDLDDDTSIECLVEQRFEDPHTKGEHAEFLGWLENLPLGVIVDFPNGSGKRIVKCHG